MRNAEPPPGSPPGGEFLLYTTEDGRSRVECRFEDETIWLSQTLMAELFETTPQNITLHLKALYEDGEIDEAATCKDYLQVRREGSREVRRSVKHYNLAAILAVGFRVRSRRGAQFRQWAISIPIAKAIRHRARATAGQAESSATGFDEREAKWVLRKLLDEGLVHRVWKGARLNTPPPVRENESRQ